MVLFSIKIILIIYSRKYAKYGQVSVAFIKKTPIFMRRQSIIMLKVKLPKTFFATVQNKLHFATHGNTAELIMGRADSNKERMGLTTWKKFSSWENHKTDVSIAKNYLTEKEIKALDRITTMYLDYAEDQAEQNIPNDNEGLVKQTECFLRFNNRELLDNPGKVTQEIAKAFAESEFGKIPHSARPAIRIGF